MVSSHGHCDTQKSSSPKGIFNNLRHTSSYFKKKKKNLHFRKWPGVYQKKKKQRTLLCPLKLYKALWRVVSEMSLLLIIMRPLQLKWSWLCISRCWPHRSSWLSELCRSKLTTREVVYSKIRVHKGFQGIPNYCCITQEQDYIVKHCIFAYSQSNLLDNITKDTATGKG